MEEIVLPNVGKLAIIGRDPGQDSLGRYRKLRGEIEGSRQRLPRGFLTLREISLSSLVLGEDDGPSCD